MRGGPAAVLAACLTLVLACGAGPPPPVLVDVSVELPGAGPADVEQQVLVPLEHAIAGVPGVLEHRGTATDGVGAVRVRLDGRVPKGRAGVTDALRDLGSVLPEGALPPMARTPGAHVRELVVRPGDAERAREALLRTPGVVDVQPVGAPRKTLIVEVDPERARALGIGSRELVDACQPLAADLTEWARTPTPTDLADALVRPGLRVGDVATVRVGPPDARVWWDGEPAVLLRIERSDANGPVGTGLPDVQAVEVLPTHTLVVEARFDAAAHRVAGSLGGELEGALVVLEPGRARVIAPIVADPAFVVPSVDGTVVHREGIRRQIVLAHPHEERLSERQLEDARAVLAGTSGVLHASLPQRIPVLALEVDRSAAASLGVAPSEVAHAYSLLAGVHTRHAVIRWGEGTTVEQLHVPTLGGSVPLARMARVTHEVGPARIDHLDGRRVEVVDVELERADTVLPLDRLVLPAGWSASVR